MITIAEALTIIAENPVTPALEVLPLAAAVGRVLAYDLVSPEPSPRYTNSAMDGYAVRWSDISQDDQFIPHVSLEVSGESRAGVPHGGEVVVGRAIKISTGAMLPAGYDMVIPVEDTQQAGDQLTIQQVGKKYQHVRYQGEEFKTGDMLLEAGTCLRAAQLALLTGVGVVQVSVRKPISVALLVTGSELMAAGTLLAAHQIRDSNTIMLQTAIAECGGRVCCQQGIVDDLAQTATAIDQAAEVAQVIICSGGVSVGEHDHVKTGATEQGFIPLFWGIKQKPGKPMFMAQRGKTLLFGLPGNPVAAYMCFHHYIAPLLAGGSQAGKARTQAVKLGEALENRGSRPTFVRVALSPAVAGQVLPTVLPVKGQGSHMLTSLSRADGYLLLPAKACWQQGDDVYLYRFPWHVG